MTAAAARMRRRAGGRRPLAVLVAVFVGLGGLGLATGAALGARDAAASSDAHDGWRGHGDGPFAGHR